MKLIGNALMRINSPDEAAIYFSKALKEKNDVSVIRDLGRALIQTHDFKGAISYYKDSLKEKLLSQNLQTFYEIATDFTNLMLKLAKHDKRKYDVLKEKLESFIETLSADLKSSNDDWILKKRLYYFKYVLSDVLTSIYFSSKKDKIETSEISKNIEEALLLSKEVLIKVKELRDEEKIKEEKEFHSNICLSLGQFYESIEQQLDFSEKAYLEALNANNLNEK